MTLLANATVLAHRLFYLDLVFFWQIVVLLLWLRTASQEIVPR